MAPLEKIILPKHIKTPNPQIYRSKNYATIDFETTNLDKGSALHPGNNTVLSVLWRTSKSEHAVSSCWGNELEQGGLLSSIEQCDFLVAHNAKFELQWLKRIGASLENIVVWDTMIAQYVIAGNRKFDLSLDGTAKYWNVGGKASTVSDMINSGICPSEIPVEWLERYCINDVEICHAVFLKQLQYCIDNNLLGVVFTRCLLTPVLADIELNGVCLDKDLVKAEYNKTLAELNEAKAKLNEYSDGINWSSNDQVADYIYNKLGFAIPLDYRGNEIRTNSGKPSVKAEVIAALKAKNQKQFNFVQLYKQVNKLESRMSKYMSKFMDCVLDSGDNEAVLYANFNQCVTATHRLSSSGRQYKVNFQNYDRGLKYVIKARHKEWRVGDRDGASLEFRVAGHIGRDAAIASDIDSGVDVHQYTSQVLTEAGEPTNRQGAKAHTFKPLYGGRSGTTAQQAYYKAFRVKYPGITKTQDRFIMYVLEYKKLVTETGLVFYWPTTKMTRTGYIVNREAICNYPVQSLATADIIPIALVYMWHYMKAAKLLSFITNTVHDSIITEEHPKESELLSEIAVESFTHKVYEYLYNVYGIKFGITLGIGTKVGSHWGKGDEVKVNVRSPFRG